MSKTILVVDDELGHLGLGRLHSRVGRGDLLAHLVDPLQAFENLIG